MRETLRTLLFSEDYPCYSCPLANLTEYPGVGFVADYFRFVQVNCSLQGWHETMNRELLDQMIRRAAVGG